MRVFHTLVLSFAASWSLFGSVASAAVPGAIEVVCDVNRTSFKAESKDETDVTFRIWDAEIGGSQVGLDYVVDMDELIVEKIKPDKFSSVKRRPYQRIVAVLGDDLSPAVVSSGSGELWLEVVVGNLTMTCAEGLAALPFSAPTARRRLHSVPFSREADTGGSGAVPAGAILLWDGGSCPSGFTRVSAYDDLFLVASATAGATGGSDAHDHGAATGSHALTTSEMPSHSHSSFIPVRDGLSGGNSDFLAGNGSGSYYPRTVATNSNGGGAGHDHGISSADSRPAYKTIVLCRKD